MVLQITISYNDIFKGDNWVFDNVGTTQYNKNKLIQPKNIEYQQKWELLLNWIQKCHGPICIIQWFAKFSQWSRFRYYYLWKS